MEHPKDRERLVTNALEEHRIEVLQRIVQEQPNTIRAAVAEAALESESIETYFTDLLLHGCISGMNSSLIYYSDTHRFFDKHYDEIENIREQISSQGITLQWPNGDLKNHFAWLAYEETARYIALVDLELV